MSGIQTPDYLVGFLHTCSESRFFLYFTVRSVYTSQESNPVPCSTSRLPIHVYLTFYNLYPYYVKVNKPWTSQLRFCSLARSVITNSEA